MKKINALIIIFSSVIGLICSILNIIDGNIYKFLISISIIPVSLLPIILRKICKFNITPITETMYLLFIFFAHLLGSILDFYHLITNYDKVMHLLSGFVTSFLALIILIQGNKFDSKDILFNCLFVISIVLMIASFWEFFEFFNDKLFCKDAQNVLTTGIYDTMMDMISAFIGSILFNIMYIFEEKSHNPLLVKKFIRELS